ncbi:hypothetical protein [Streptomyces sp. NPDC048277]|uniref:hypothetical protein n=1 Tax=Streptomyces sp. NPDC048277 TaxID=3155027 RepID=UPI00340C56B8
MLQRPAARRGRVPAVRVDVRGILLEVGSRGPAGGRENVIVDIAPDLPPTAAVS